MEYSTKLNHRMNRYIVKCILIDRGPKALDFVVDTGALYTCCSYLNVNSRLSEIDFTTVESKRLGGIVSGYGIRFYKYRLNRFMIGKIDMGKRDIWITFDQLATDDVLGMDILKDIQFTQFVEKRELVFYQEKRM